MVKPDVKKIFQLIKEWDQRARRGTMPPPRPQPSAITRFAASLHEPPRHRQSFWNMRAGKLISEDFAAQIARALRVEVADITLPDAAGAEAPQPEAEVRKAA